MISKIIAWLNEINTTAFRIIATVGVMYIVTFRYVASGITLIAHIHIDPWEPSPPFLLFIWGMAGVDGAVLVAKRLTDHKYKEIVEKAKVAAANNPSPITVGTANVDAPGATVTSTTENQS